MNTLEHELAADRTEPNLFGLRLPSSDTAQDRSMAGERILNRTPKFETEIPAGVLFLGV